MPAKWTYEIVAKMHMFKLSQKKLAEIVGYTPEYLSMVLNGKRNSKCAQEKVTQAIQEIEATLR